MVRVLERVDFGARQGTGETFQEVPVEHEVAQSPADEGRSVGEPGQPAPRLLHQIPRAIARSQRARAMPGT